jgi:hypothetical protein
VTPAQFEAFVRQRAAVHKVDPDLAVSIWRAETGGRVGNVVGDAGRSVGPWQILDTTAKQLGLSAGDRADPVKSTEAVMPLIRKLSDKAMGDWALTRLGYMRGEGAMTNPQQYAGHAIAGGNMRRFAALQQAHAGKSLAQALVPDAAHSPADIAAAFGLSEESAPGSTIEQPQVAAVTPEFDAAMFDILGLTEDQAWPLTSTEQTA